MTIYRDGQAIELIWQEIRDAHEEWATNSAKEDIKSIAEDMEVDIPVEALDKLAHHLDDVITNDDGYWDDYWCDVEYVVKEYLKGKEIKQ